MLHRTRDKLQQLGALSPEAGEFIEELQATILSDFRNVCESQYTRGVTRGLSRLTDTQDLRRQVATLCKQAEINHNYECGLIEGLFPIEPLD